MELVPHRSVWRRLFAAERRRLRRRLGAAAVDVRHVGSTAVPGLAAKPVLDIALAVRDLAAVPGLLAPLAELGYEYRGEFGLPGREFFVRGRPRTHHLHVVRHDSGHWRAWLLFRDYLRHHPKEAARYAAFKRRKARQYAHDRAGYTASKAGLVARMLKRAAAEAEKKPRGGHRPPRRRK